MPNTLPRLGPRRERCPGLPESGPRSNGADPTQGPLLYRRISQWIERNVLRQAKEEADRIIATPDKYQVVLLAFAIEVEIASIDEDMIHHDVEQVGCRHLEDVFVKVLPAEGHPWL